MSVLADVKKQEVNCFMFFVQWLWYTSLFVLLLATNASIFSLMLNNVFWITLLGTVTGFVVGFPFSFAFLFKDHVLKVLALKGEEYYGRAGRVYIRVAGVTILSYATCLVMAIGFKSLLFFKAQLFLMFGSISNIYFLIGFYLVTNLFLLLCWHIASRHTHQAATIS